MPTRPPISDNRRITTKPCATLRILSAPQPRARCSFAPKSMAVSLLREVGVAFANRGPERAVGVVRLRDVEAAWG